LSNGNLVAGFFPWKFQRERFEQEMREPSEKEMFAFQITNPTHLRWLRVFHKTNDAEWTFLTEHPIDFTQNPTVLHEPEPNVVLMELYTHWYHPLLFWFDLTKGQVIKRLLIAQSNLPKFPTSFQNAKLVAHRKTYTLLWDYRKSNYVVVPNSSGLMECYGQEGFDECYLFDRWITCRSSNPNGMLLANLRTGAELRMPYSYPQRSLTVIHMIKVADRLLVISNCGWMGLVQVVIRNKSLLFCCCSATSKHKPTDKLMSCLPEEVASTVGKLQVPPGRCLFLQ
jgi:hypothetical protein